MKKMNVNRKILVSGLVGIGVVGALVTGGVAAAQAVTDDSPISQQGWAGSSTVDIHHSGDVMGMAFGQNSLMAAVENYLGLSQTELQGQLQSGESLADAAESQGKSVSGLKDAMVAALKVNVDANTSLTSEQKIAAIERLDTRINAMVNNAHRLAEGMGMGAQFGAGDGMHDGADVGSGMDWR